MNKGFLAALAVGIVLAAGSGAAMAQRLDTRIDTSKRDIAICHGDDPDKAINACGNLIRNAPDVMGYSGVDNSAGCGGACTAAVNPMAMTGGVGNNPIVADATIARALAYLKKNRFDDAISDCNRVISFLPNTAACYGIRAAAFAGKNMDDNALADAEKGVALDPGNAAVLTTRGQVFEKIGARDEALADYRRAVQIDPNLDGARLGLVRLGAP